MTYSVMRSGQAFQEREVCAGQLAEIATPEDPLERAGCASTAVVPFLHVSVAPQRFPRAAQWRGKRALDLVGAIGLTILFCPLILIVAAWLRLSGGPVLFGHTRIGRGGRPFICYKFCTMVRDADRVLKDVLQKHPELRREWLETHKLKRDPRVTRLGRILRRTSFDELPQLWNVLKGEMSLVGPRPIVRAEMPKYGRTLKHYLATRPGLTGLWQVTGRNDTTYRRRVAMDRLYAWRCSVVLDMRILLLTVRVVVARVGAY